MVDAALHGLLLDAFEPFGNTLDVVDDTVSGLKIDGVEPTEEEILAGNYMLQRPFVMATKGEMSGQNELVQAWFNYINSDDGKEVSKQVGLIIPQ